MSRDVYLPNMIYAENPCIIPVSDQGPDNFTVPIEYQLYPLTVKLPLSVNGVLSVLRPLANHLGLGFHLSPHESKEKLIKLITPNLSLLPMTDAILRWPQLDEPVPTTFAAAQDVLTRFMEEEWVTTLRQETPQFIPHLHKRIAEYKKVYNMLEYEEQVKERDWQQLRERFHTRAPAWCMQTLRKPPADGKHYVITLTKLEKWHDRYCSDGEEFRTEKVESKVFYLPITTGWTPADIPIGQEWIIQDECDCCGMAEEKWRVISCELV
jgi:hypothetical protein